jgi:hypothetical protein
MLNLIETHNSHANTNTEGEHCAGYSTVYVGFRIGVTCLCEIQHKKALWEQMNVSTNCKWW